MSAPGSSSAREWSILLAACGSKSGPEKSSQIEPLLKGSVNWRSLLALADRHGSEPLLYQSLVDVEDKVPAQQMQALKQIYQDNVSKSLLLSRELIRILDHLSAAGIGAMPHKGLALAKVVYGDIASRRAGDIDLLIHAEDLSRIREIVRDLGYSPQLTLSPAEERAYLKSGYERAFDSAIGRNLLELQWAVQPRFYSVGFDMDGVFERAVTVSLAGRSTKTPAPADLMLILSTHAAKHAWGRLVWLCDIAQLLQSPNLDWDWIRSQAEDLGITRIVSITMTLAHRLLEAPIPAAAKVSQDAATTALVDEARDSLMSEAVYNVESFAYFRLMLRLRERSIDRLRFLTHLALTPGPGDWQAVRLPGLLFPLYRLVRLARLGARAVGA